MKINEMKPHSEFKRMYAAWIKSDGMWYPSGLLFDSMDHIRRRFESMPEFSERHAPHQTDRWRHAEIIAVPVEVAIPD